MRNKLLIAMAAMTLSTAAMADVQDGLSAWNAGDYETATRIWTPMAANGDADAMFYMGQAFRFGKGVPINLPLATDLILRSANMGHMIATLEIGLILYQDGRKAQAFYYLKKAAGYDDPKAAYLVGVSLFNGEGVQENKSDGIFFLKQSAKAGFKPAQDALANINDAPLAEAAMPIKTGGYTLQLGAFKVNGNAERLWNSLSDKVPFGDHEPTLVQFGDFTLLKVRGYGRVDAKAMCVKIRSVGHECVVQK